MIRFKPFDFGIICGGFTALAFDSFMKREMFWAVLYALVAVSAWIRGYRKPDNA